MGFHFPLSTTLRSHSPGLRSLIEQLECAVKNLPTRVAPLSAQVLHPPPHSALISQPAELLLFLDLVSALFSE